MENPYFLMDNLGGFPIIFGGPLPAISGVITPMSRVFHPICPFIRPFIGVITPFIPSRGPPCRGYNPFTKYQQDIPNIQTPRAEKV